MDATAPQRLRFSVAGGLPDRPVAVWSTDLSSTDSRRWFVREGSVRPVSTVTDCGSEASGLHSLCHIDWALPSTALRGS